MLVHHYSAFAQFSTPLEEPTADLATTDDLGQTTAKGMTVGDRVVPPSSTVTAFTDDTGLTIGHVPPGWTVIDHDNTPFNEKNKDFEQEADDLIQSWGFNPNRLPNNNKKKSKKKMIEVSSTEYARAHKGLIRLLKTIWRQKSGKITTRKLLQALDTVGHGQTLIRLAEKQGYIKRDTVKIKGKKGAPYVVNILTPKGRKLLAELKGEGRLL